MLKNKSGFTLIELLAIILIIGTLAGIAIPNYRTATLKAKITVNMPMLKSLQSDMINYYNLTNALPNRLSQLSINKAEFDDNGKHLATNCTFTLSNILNHPHIAMDCQDGWNMTYSLQQTPLGYTFGERTFTITATGSEQARLQKIANSFGWTGEGNTYTIR